MLVSLAYISLGLGDAVSALSYSRQLLGVPQVPGGLWFLGRLYAAEALVLQGKTQEATQLLLPEEVTDLSISLATHGGPRALLVFVMITS